MDNEIDFIDQYHRDAHTAEEIMAMGTLSKFVTVWIYGHSTMGTYINTFDTLGYKINTVFGWIGGDGSPCFTIIFERAE